MERTEENNATKDRFAHVGKIFGTLFSKYYWVIFFGNISHLG